MLKGPLALVVLVALALAGAEARRRLRGRGVGGPMLENFFFVAVGVGLGSLGLGLFPDELVTTLRPIVLLGVTWIGLVVGLQLDLKVLARLKAWHRLVGFGVPAVTGGVVAVGAVLVGRPTDEVVLLAAVAMVASPRVILLLARTAAPADRAAMRLLKLVTALSSIPALVLFGTVAALTGVGAGWLTEVLGGGERLLLMVGLAVVLGYATNVLLAGERAPVHILAVLIGITALSAGAAILLGGEPMLMGLITGAVIMNRCRFPHRILRAAHALETPLLIALLVLLGAWWRPGAFQWTAVLLLVGLRAAVLIALGFQTASMARRRGAPVRRSDLGAGLLPQGPLALAILVASVAQGQTTPAVGEAVFAAMLVNHLLGWLWTRRILFGEAGPSERERP
ncbi:MAG: hypothetical protein LJE95_09750 [Acidobacteria bacterium]|nr:hypothetical protein [Acidobacteriota bacterium]